MTQQKDFRLWNVFPIPMARRIDEVLVTNETLQLFLSFYPVGPDKMKCLIRRSADPLVSEGSVRKVIFTQMKVLFDENMNHQYIGIIHRCRLWIEALCCIVSLHLNYNCLETKISLFFFLTKSLSLHQLSFILGNYLPTDFLLWYVP